MAATTGIEWTDATWNPVTGCTKLSPGCKNCYAERMTKRLKAMGQRRYANGFAVATHADALTVPLRWKKPRSVFVNSMSDLFHQVVPDEFIDRVFAVMALCQQHTFQVLTKRPERMAAWFRRYSDSDGEDPVLGDTGIGNWLNGLYGNLMRDSGILPGGSQKWRWNAPEMDYHEPWREAVSGYYEWLGDDDERPIPWPLPNVILQVSVEDQQRADERIPKLLECPAALHFLSAEPLLGELNLTSIRYRADGREHCIDALRGEWAGGKPDFPTLSGWGSGRLGWVIVGTESGPKRRPTNIAHIRSLRDQCVAAGIPFLLKQMAVNGKLVKMPTLDGRQWNEFPEVIHDR